MALGILLGALVVPFAAHLPSTLHVEEGGALVALADLGASFTRLVIAYFFSLGFSLAYGYYAATNRTAERILIPVLDILQSVPILGFVPIVLVAFLTLTPGSLIGPNLGVIFLIFTSMSWNMAFGVYESIKGMPTDIREAADSFGVRGVQRLRHVILPATATRLVYNTVLSWTAGWYFLVGAEIISAGTVHTTLPGIGSYLATAAAPPVDGSALITGLAFLIALVAALDLLVWRPVGQWAEKFRYEQAPSGEGTEGTAPRPRPPIQRAAGYMARGFSSGVSRLRGPLVTFVRRVPVVGTTAPGRRTRSVIRAIILGILLLAVWLLLIELAVGIYHIFVMPIPPAVLAQIDELPLALLYSSLRIIAAYAISVAIVLPLTIYLVSRPRAYLVGLPAIEIVASVPASSLFPLFIVALSPFFGLNGIAILLLVTGMIWYLFFNIISGLRGIPADLKEAAASYGLSRSQYLRRLVLPSIFPAFVTGSITAIGSGWNTLVFAEYFAVNGTVLLHVLGVGELISISSFMGLPALSVASLFTLILTVVVVNELVWKPMYRRAVNKYRYD